jgi:hypothetical protein
LLSGLPFVQGALREQIVILHRRCHRAINYSAGAEFQERGGQNHVIRMIDSSTAAILLVRSIEQLS